MIKSERDFLSGLSNEGLAIQRYWEMKVVQVRAKTLAVHKGGFLLCYYTPLVDKSALGPPVSPGTIGLSSHTSIEIGVGVRSAGMGYITHVVVPNFTTLTHNHATYIRRHWVNDILIPAIQVVLPREIGLSHPTSYDQAWKQYKLGLTREHYVEHKYLEVISSQLKERACLEPWKQDFSGFSFVTYNTASTRLNHESMLADSYSTCLKAFEEVYGLESSSISGEDIWLEIVAKDIPQCHDGTAVTLLPKSGCMPRGSDLFGTSKPAKAGLGTVSMYPCNGLKEASSMEVRVQERGSLKDVRWYLQSVRMDGDGTWGPNSSLSSIFNNTDFELLPFSADFITSQGLPVAHGVDTAYGEAKQYLRGQFFQKDNRGIRKTFYCRMSHLALSMKSADASVVHSVRIQSSGVVIAEGSGVSIAGHAITSPHQLQLTTEHLPYWVIDSQSINSFRSVASLRCLKLMDIMIERTKVCSHHQQLINGVLFTIILSVLRFFLGAHDHRTAALNDLDLYKGMEEHGFASLSTRDICWAIPMVTKSGIHNLVHLAPAALQASYSDLSIMYRDIDFNTKTLLRFAEIVGMVRDSTGDLARNENKLFQLGAEMIIQAFITNIWDEISKLDPNYREELTHEEKGQVRACLMGKLSAETIAGMRGLTMEMIELVTGRDVSICTSPLQDSDGKPSSELWRNQIQFVFRHAFEQWSPTEELGIPAWSRQGFVYLGRKLNYIISEVLGDAAATRFRIATYDWASHYIWALPRHDGQHFFLLQNSKSDPSRSQHVNREMRGAPGLSRTEWLVVGPQDIQLRREISNFNGLARNNASRRMDPDRAERLWGKGKTMLRENERRWAVMSSENLVDLRMTRLNRFLRDIKSAEA